MSDDRESAGWGERAVNKVARLAIARLVEAEQIDVWVKTTLPQAMRGEVDSIAIKLQGFLGRENLQIETFQLQIGAVAVITKLAVKGTIQLIQPANGTLIVVLKQHQLDYFLKTIFLNQSEMYSSSTQNFIQNYHIHQINTVFIDSNQIQITLTWEVSGTRSVQSSTVLMTPTIAAGGQAVQLVVQSASGQDMPAALLTMLLSSIEEILSLEDFKQRGTSFQIQRLESTEDVLTLFAAATIDQFPTR